MRLPQRSSKAFTLIELIVVIIILGILALIAIPTFGKVIGKSQDQSTISSLRAIAREAQALRALDQAPAWGTIPEDAVGETMQAASPGVLAATALKAVVDNGTRNPVAGEVSYKVIGDGVVLSMLSGSKRICVVGLDLSSTSPGVCLEPGKDAKGATTTASTASVLSSGTDSIIPTTSTSTGGGSTAPALAVPASRTLVTGYATTCSVTTTGSIRCAGWNNRGQVGDGTQTNTSTFKTVPGITNAAQVAAGTYQTCALLTDSTVKCWGLVGNTNVNYSLGNGVSKTGSFAPVDVTGLTGVKQISSGQAQSCALLNTGTVKCWGGNTSGELGDGTNVSSNVPVDVKNLTGISSISTSDRYTCAIKGGNVWCWGYDNGTGRTYSVPTQVPSISNAVQVVSSTYQTCALTTDSTVKCWGSNSFNQLNNTATPSTSTTPLDVPGITDATSISTGAGHVCAIRANKTLTCWGYNVYGQAGNSSMATVGGMTNMSLSNVVAVSLGAYYSTAVTETNGVRKAYAWGQNGYGEFGITPPTSSSTPTEIIGY